MQHSVYIITDSANETLHIGITPDLSKTLAAYHGDNTSLWPADKQSAKLVWYQRFDSYMVTESKYRGIMEMDKQTKLELIKKHNPQFEDLTELALRLADKDKYQNNGAYMRTSYKHTGLI